MKSKKYVSKVLLSILLCFFLCFASNCKNNTKYLISFYVENEIYETIKTKGNIAVALPNPPTKFGHVFDGWYVDINDEATLFNEDTLIKSPIKNNLNLYAKFSPGVYSITFETGFTSVNPPQKIMVTFGGNFTLPTLEDIENYTFKGWAYQNQLISDGEYIYGEDITVIASWERTFDFGGNT